MKKEIKNVSGKILKGIGYVIGGIVSIVYLCCNEPKEYVSVYRSSSDNSDINKELDRLWRAYDGAFWSDDKEKILKRIEELQKKL